MTNKVIRGVIHGRTIELLGDVGLRDGEEVEVVVCRVQSPTSGLPGEGFLRTEGALANDTEWDAIMDEVHRSRKLERRPQMEDV